MTRVSIREIVAPHFWNTFNSKKTHQIDKGGRGSTKTSKDSLKVSMFCEQYNNCSAVIFRKYQNTLRNSVYKVQIPLLFWNEQLLYDIAM